MSQIQGVRGIVKVSIVDPRHKLHIIICQSNILLYCACSQDNFIELAPRLLYYAFLGWKIKIGKEKLLNERKAAAIMCFGSSMSAMGVVESRIVWEWDITVGVQKSIGSRENASHMLVFHACEVQAEVLGL